MTRRNDGTGDILYSYDGDGNVIQRGAVHLIYDSSSRIIGSGTTAGSFDNLSIDYDVDGYRLYELTPSSGLRVFFRDLFEYSNMDYTTRVYFYAFGERFAVRIEDQSILRSAWMPPAGSIPLPSAPAALAALSLLTLGALVWRGRQGDLDLVLAHPARAGVAALSVLTLLPHPASAGGGDGSGTGYFRYLFTDHLGSEVLVTTEAGDVVQRRVFEPFGKVFSAGQETEPSDQHFAGHTLEAESGLYLTAARAYDPDAGRFLSVDPIVANPADPEGLNPYTYARNNPIRYVDPLGLEVVSITGFLISIAIQVAARLGREAVEKKLAHVANPIALSNVDAGPDVTNISLESDSPAGSAAQADSRVGAEGINNNPDVHQARGVDDESQSETPGGNGGQTFGEAAANTGGTVAGIAEYSNVQGGQWRGANGRWYSVEAAPGRARPFFGNQFTGSRAQVLERASGFKILGRTFFAASAAMSLVEGTEAAVSGNPAGVARAGLDAAMAGVATFGGPLGLTVGTTYFVLDALGATSCPCVPTGSEIGVIPVPY